MSLSKLVYAIILKKINLSKDELVVLKKRLNKKKICAGPFVREGKMCPVTTAASIKLKAGRFNNNQIVKEKLKSLGVSKPKLFFFYLTFDLPAMFSQNFFQKRLKELVEATAELMKKS